MADPNHLICVPSRHFFYTSFLARPRVLLPALSGLSLLHFYIMKNSTNSRRSSTASTGSTCSTASTTTIISASTTPGTTKTTLRHRLASFLPSLTSLGRESTRLLKFEMTLQIHSLVHYPQSG